MNPKVKATYWKPDYCFWWKFIWKWVFQTLKYFNYKRENNNKGFLLIYSIQTHMLIKHTWSHSNSLSLVQPYSLLPIFIANVLLNRFLSLSAAKSASALYSQLSCLSFKCWFRCSEQEGYLSLCATADRSAGFWEVTALWVVLLIHLDAGLMRQALLPAAEGHGVLWQTGALTLARSATANLNITCKAFHFWLACSHAHTIIYTSKKTPSHTGRHFCRWVIEFRETHPWLEN